MSDSEFEALVNQLQEKSFAEARQAFGEKGLQRWLHPRYNRPLEFPDASARACGSCGDSIEISLKFRNNKVVEASYATDGCASSGLCGSFTAELAHGRNPQEIMALTPQDVLDSIGVFPSQDKHCATLAVLALHKALNTYLVNRVPDRKWIVSGAAWPPGKVTE